MLDSESKKIRLSLEDSAKLELDRQTYDKLGAEQSLSLDKSIISISGASFGVAIAFIDKMINKQEAILLWMFWFSMLALVVAIIATTLSFLFSEQTIRYARKCVDDCEATGDINELHKQNPHIKKLERANTTRLYAFILGMATLVSFIFLNGVYQTYFK